MIPPEETKQKLKLAEDRLAAATLRVEKVEAEMQAMTDEEDGLTRPGKYH